MDYIYALTTKYVDTVKESCMFLLVNIYIYIYLFLSSNSWTIAKCIVCRKQKLMGKCKLISESKAYGGSGLSWKSKMYGFQVFWGSVDTEIPALERKNCKLNPDIFLNMPLTRVGSKTVKGFNLYIYFSCTEHPWYALFTRIEGKEVHRFDVTL